MILPPPVRPTVFDLIVEIAELLLILRAGKWLNDRKDKKCAENS